MQTRGLESLGQFLRKHLDYYDHYQTHFEQDLAQILQDNLAEDQSEDDARVLAHKCARDERDADDKVNQILASINLDMDDVLKRARARKAEKLTQYNLKRKPVAIKLIDKLLAGAKFTIPIAIVTGLIAPSALAADMAVKGPPAAPAPVYNWTGWYVGVNAGASFGDAKT